MFCDHCGATLRENAEFCHVCGAKLLLSPAAEPAAVVSAPKPEREPETEPAGKEENAVSRPAQTPQPLCGTFSWDNVKISGEFQNGVGTLTITFSQSENISAENDG